MALYYAGRRPPRGNFGRTANYEKTLENKGGNDGHLTRNLPSDE